MSWDIVFKRLMVEDISVFQCTSITREREKERREREKEREKERREREEERERF